MPLLRVEAEKLSNRYLEAGVIEELINKDDLFGYLPFMQVNNKTYDYTREDETAIAAAIAGDTHAKFAAVNDEVVEAAVPFVEVSAKLRILHGDVDIDKFLQETMGDTNAQKAQQIIAKTKIVREKYKRAWAIGDSTANPLEFDGIKKLCSSAQTFAAGNNGAPLAFDMLDELKDMIPYGADALVMHQRTWRAIKAMMRALNIQPEHVAVPEVGIMVPTYDGTPIIRNDYLPTNEVKGDSGATCTSIYAVRFNEADGMHGIFGGSNAGIRIEEIGTVQNKDATRTRIKFYAGSVLKSTKSLARLEGIKLA